MNIIKLISAAIVLAALSYGIHYAWISFPIISGYGAKNMCSCVFVSGMDKERVKSEELGRYPLTFGTYKVNFSDSSVTATVFGFAKKKAIYRKGLGCTLINGADEDALRAQVFKLPSWPLINPDTIPWPLGDRVVNDTLSKFDRVKLAKILDAEINKRDAKSRQGTRSLLVLYDGQIVGERYAEGITKETKLLGWSMAKSVTAALIGILVKEGKLNVNNPVGFPEWSKASDKRNGILLKHLLQQTSGLNFEENYTKSCDVTKMLFQNADMAAYVLSRPLAHEPGTVFNYSSGNSHLLSLTLRRTLGEKKYHSFPYEALFYPAGMFNTILEPDATGTFVGSSYIYATTRDYARFGLLYLNKGLINGQQLLPPDWVIESVIPSSADKLNQYGYQVWLNGRDEKDPARKIYPAGPDDLYFMDGVAGQRILVIPSKKTIIVRMGFIKEDIDPLIRAVLACIPPQ
jgi:CubicO group peptidase (beta-lactamase class C family)